MMRGFSLFEIILSISIATIILIAVAEVVYGIPAVLESVHTHDEGLNRAYVQVKEGIYTAISDFALSSSTSTTTEDGYDTSRSVLEKGIGSMKQITGTSSWIDRFKNKHYTSVTGFSTDYRHATEVCDPFLSGTWLTSKRSDYSFTAPSLWPELASLAGSFIPSALAIHERVLYVGMRSTSHASDPTLFTFSLSDPFSPTFMGAVDNASTTKSGVAAITVAGSRLFAASLFASNFSTCKAGTSNCAQLHIVSAGDPSKMEPDIFFTLSTSTPPYAVGSGGQAVGNAVTYADGRVYLGVTKTGSVVGDEFNVIDATSPRWLGGYHIGRTVTSISIQGTYAYVTTDDPTRDLIVLDVHDPSAITQVGYFDAPSPRGGGTANAVALTGTTLYLVRDYTGSDHELYNLSIEDPHQPVLRGSSDVLYGLSSVSAYRIIVQNIRTFILSKQDFQVWDGENPVQPKRVASLPLPNGSRGTDLSCSQGNFYVTSENGSTGYLSIFQSL